MTKEKNQSTEIGTAIDAKEVLKEQVGNKVVLSERMSLEIIKDSKFYKVGQLINPHRVIGEDLVKNKIAIELK